MDYLQIILEILVNAISLFLIASAFVNIDLLNFAQIFLFSLIIMNCYFINKKVLRTHNCKINQKQVIVAFGMSVVNMLFLLVLKKGYRKIF